MGRATSQLYLQVADYLTKAIEKKQKPSIGKEPPTFVVLHQDEGDVERDCLAKPRNPRDFEAIAGGRKRVSDTFTHKNSGSCM